MESIIRFIIAIFSMVVLVYIIKNIFGFFRVNINIYGIYLLTFIVLAILFGVLPREVGTVFSSEEE